MVATVNYYRPTYAAAEDIFTAPPEHRPFVDLSLSREPARLPFQYRRSNTGVTRWANLVIGVAVDGAIERGVRPERIAEAFAIGEVVAHADIAFDPLYDEREVELLGAGGGTGFEGAVELHGSQLTVAGAAQGYSPDATITFEKQGGVYVPRSATYTVIGEDEPRRFDMSDPFSYSRTLLGPREVPQEFLPGERLGDIEEAVTAGLDVLVLRGDITNLQN